MNIRFRVAELQDWATVEPVVAAAFAPEEVVSFLNSLREEGCVIGEWIAESEREILAHVAFSRAYVDDGASLRPAAFLTPLAVQPRRQRQGIGQRLLLHALGALEGQGEDLFFVLGHPTYYPKIGFQAELARDVECRWRGRSSFMARCQTAPSGRLLAPIAIATAH